MFRFLLKPLSFVPALCVMYMIFSFSAQTADESGQLSMLVSEKVVLLLGKLTSGNLDTAQVGVYADEIHFLVRKMAHFSEYFLLGLTLSLPLYVYRLRGFWLVLAAGLFCAGFAGLDEYHQMFAGTSGRGDRYGRKHHRNLYDKDHRIYWEKNDICTPFDGKAQRTEKTTRRSLGMRCFDCMK